MLRRIYSGDHRPNYDHKFGSQFVHSGGIQVYSASFGDNEAGEVWFEPVNSKGVGSARCRIVVHAYLLPELIQTLQHAQSELDEAAAKRKLEEA